MVTNGVHLHFVHQQMGFIFAKECGQTKPLFLLPQFPILKSQSKVRPHQSRYIRVCHDCSELGALSRDTVAFHRGRAQHLL